MAEPRYLIVGGAGYFGPRLAEALSKDANVTITQRTTSAARSAWIEQSGLDVVEFDSARQQEIPALGDFDAVINLAMPGAAEAARDPDAAGRHSSRTLQACLRLLEQARAPRLVHFSTFHVYGAGGRACYSETDEPSPIHPYGRIHQECETLALQDPRTIVVRPSNLVGAPSHAGLGDQAKLLLLDLGSQAARGAIKLHNDGRSYRDFLPFDDAVEAVRLLLGIGHDTRGETLFNLARGVSMPLSEAAALVQQAAGNRPSLEFGAGQDAFREPFRVSIERLRKLGWEPRASLVDELARIVAFFRSSG